MKSRDIFIVLYFFIFILLNVLVGFCLKSFGLLTLIHFVIIQLVNIGIAYNFTELLISLITKRKDLPKLDMLKNYPAVALIYVTYNDVCPKLLGNLKNQNYQNYDIFVLDDSIDESQKIIIDRCGYKIVRRGKRNGFKAGALNNWLRLYGSNYKYFIISDSDSAFNDNFIEDMIKYAEHPLNQRIAIFQSIIKNWNNKNKFPRILSSLYPLYYYFAFKLFNEFEYIVSYGHNNLHRTNIINHVGGFDENFIAEDHAMSLKLIREGYQSKLVDIISYEMSPETLRSYSRRQARWARQDFELIRFNMERIPFITKLHLFITIYNFVIWFVYLIGIIIILFGHNISVSDLNSFRASLNGGSMASKDIFILAIWISYILIFVINRLPLAIKLGIPAGAYFKNLALSVSVNYFSVFHIIIALIKAIIKCQNTFNVTEKNRSKYSIIQEFKFSIIFIMIIFFGSYCNPLALMLNFIWLTPILLSPAIIYMAKD